MANLKLGMAETGTQKNSVVNLKEIPEMIFIDFDGVISKNSVLLNMKNAHQFINQYTAIPFKALFDFLKSTTCFSFQHTISFLLSSLGIEEEISGTDLEKAIADIYSNVEIKIEADFFKFLDFCDRIPIPYMIYSSAAKGIKELSVLSDRVGKNNIYDLSGRSKASYATYSATAEDLKLNLNKCMYIDDTPLALRTGKLHGMTTVMMLNDVFTLVDYQVFSSYVDYAINSFAELEAIIRKRL
jgi:beta-phosphoglucomutase-like phosphatase (HAD superfamily)